ncbi:Sulfite reductase [NADPH] flavoprotein alpha-component [Novipirellula galeiformis]|uniref:assimilatory sulfite reductase (NADPH) n=1 Tax=Novipirellula galeiformis TaxID=2528004 RepID=A0A5C6CHP1_9BACT|nr:sulfite reductase subunit alpha [Novipirellula galeiformis]TWU23888.1 Sulfite reductase [NADPH] flavoprotein alpha-component [Novipirellula galeiformis]
MSSLIPDTAPFSQEQRAWLNGFFSGMMGIQSNTQQGEALAAMGFSSETIATPSEPAEEEDFPWHDESLPILDRMSLAEDKPLDRKLMAAMAQLDCGSCGYLCQTYSEAIASGTESNLSLCSPGGKETKQMIKKLLKDSGGAEASGAAAAPLAGDAPGASRSAPYTAKLLASRCLNKEGSAKAVHHVEIDLSGSGIKYEVGDALGVCPSNCSELVSEILQRIESDPNAEVTTPLGNTKPFKLGLQEDCCLKDPSDELLESLISRTADATSKQALAKMLEDGVPDGVDVLDTLSLASDVKLTASELMETLEPLNPRLYSIASSMKAVGEQVHLTVGKVLYEREGRVRKGVASTMLTDRLESGSSLRIFTHANHTGFTVPTDLNVPIIMVGPGTGIAPFVAFLQERVATKSSGKNWLLFGDQHEAYDFLYEEQLQAYVEAGCLQRLDTAFSRDGDKKVYVQDRMRENGAELFQWLTEGAHFYVCGDASRMAADVDRTLKAIVAEHGNMSEEQADQYVASLSKTKRYVRDVY